MTTSTLQTHEDFSTDALSEMPIFIHAVEEYEKFLGKLIDFACDCGNAA